jgi:hypothetical protein
MRNANHLLPSQSALKVDLIITPPQIHVATSEHGDEPCRHNAHAERSLFGPVNSPSTAWRTGGQTRARSPALVDAAGR